MHPLSTMPPSIANYFEKVFNVNGIGAHAPSPINLCKFCIGSRYLRHWFPVISSRFTCGERDGEHGEEVVRRARRIQSQKRERWEKLSQALLSICFLKEQQQSSERAREAMASLEDVSNDDLFAEFLRRMKCATKGEKRIILIGIAAASLQKPHLSRPCCFVTREPTNISMIHSVASFLGDRRNHTSVYFLR